MKYNKKILNLIVLIAILVTGTSASTVENNDVGEEFYNSHSEYKAEFTYTGHAVYPENLESSGRLGIFIYGKNADTSDYRNQMVYKFYWKVLFEKTNYYKFGGQWYAGSPSYEWRNTNPEYGPSMSNFLYMSNTYLKWQGSQETYSQTYSISAGIESTKGVSGLDLGYSYTLSGSTGSPTVTGDDTNSGSYRYIGDISTDLLAGDVVDRMFLELRMNSLVANDYQDGVTIYLSSTEKTVWKIQKLEIKVDVEWWNYMCYPTLTGCLFYPSSHEKTFNLGDGNLEGNSGYPMEIGFARGNVSSIFD